MQGRRITFFKGIFDLPVAEEEATFLRALNVVLEGSGFRKRPGSVLAGGVAAPKEVNWGDIYGGGSDVIAELDPYPINMKVWERFNSTKNQMEQVITVLFKGVIDGGLFNPPEPDDGEVLVVYTVTETDLEVTAWTRVLSKQGGGGVLADLPIWWLGYGDETGRRYPIYTQAYQNRLYVCGYPYESDSESESQGILAWTDGIEMYQAGISPPDSPVLVQAGAGSGGLIDGEYYVTARYRRAGAFPAKGNPCFNSATNQYYEESHILSGGTETQSLKVRAKFSPDPQVTNIDFFRTKVNDISTYYFAASITNNSAQGGVYPATWTELTLSDSALSQDFLGNVTVEILNFDDNRPPKSIGMAVVGNRAFYLTMDYLYYSKVGEPESVPIGNRIGLSVKGDQNVGVFGLGDLVLVFTTSETYCFDSRSPAEGVTWRLSSRVGLLGGAVIVGDEVAIWLSHDGFWATNGQTMIPLSYVPGEGSRNQEELLRNIDFTRADEITAVFDGRLYTCAVPYKNGGHAVWIWDIIFQNWAGVFQYPVRPGPLELAKLGNGDARIIWGVGMTGKQSSVEDTYTFLVKEEKSSGQDVKYGSNVPGEVQSDPVTFDVIEAWHAYSGGEMQKQADGVGVVTSNVSGNTTLKVTFGSDFGARKGEVDFVLEQTTAHTPGTIESIGWEIDGVERKSSAFGDWTLDDATYHHGSVRFEESSTQTLAVRFVTVYYTDKTPVLEV
jgi:hypothetical protein